MYFKILNEDECYNGMQYKTGLNVDILPFVSAGNCQPGGIYFASKDIFAFCDYGPWVREVTLPEDEEIYQNPGEPLKFKSHKVILGERKRLWDLKTIKWMIENGADVHANDDLALCRASTNGHLEVVEFLVKDEYSLRYASENGHLEVVEFLVKNGADVHANDDLALCWASENDHLEIVEFLKRVS